MPIMIKNSFLEMFKLSITAISEYLSDIAVGMENIGIFYV